jgi:hypothetical protein
LSTSSQTLNKMSVTCSTRMLLHIFDRIVPFDEERIILFLLFSQLVEDMQLKALCLESYKLHMTFVTFDLLFTKLCPLMNWKDLTLNCMKIFHWNFIHGIVFESYISSCSCVVPDLFSTQSSSYSLQYTQNSWSFCTCI